MSTTTNYTTNGVTRKVDLYTQGVFNFNRDSMQQLNPSMGVSQGGYVCAGVVKLAQKAVNTLLNYDLFYDTAWGTALSALLMAGNMTTVRREFAAFMGAALNGVVQQLSEQYTSTTPLDEQLDGFRMTSWTVYLDTVTVNLQLVTKNHVKLDIVVPISVVP